MCPQIAIMGYEGPKAPTFYYQRMDGRNTMRIHTDSLKRQDIVDALRTATADNRVGSNVVFDVLSEHRSTIRARAFEVQLIATSNVGPQKNGRQFTNSGGYGAGNAYAATHDEWGWLLSELFKLDPNMVCGGSAKNRIYDGAAHFHHRTALSYAPLTLLNYMPGADYDYDPYPYVLSRKYGVNYGFVDGYRASIDMRKPAGATVRERTREQVLARLTPAELAAIGNPDF